MANAHQTTALLRALIKSVAAATEADKCASAGNENGMYRCLAIAEPMLEDALAICRAFKAVRRHQAASPAKAEARR